VTGKKGSLLIWGTGLAYFLIGVEIIIMISPFALYFYSVYGPILNSLAANPLTGWTTEFFLPHMVFLDDPLIAAISYLQLLMVAGLLLFFSAAVPLYYGRFTGKGVVQLSFYAKVRHPQYLFLAISGFGLMLYWPRFIILVLYITMLFVYYALARNEEWRMLREQPEAYGRYMEKTPMFLPGEPGGRFFRLILGWVRPKWLGIVAAYCLSILVAVLLALGIRDYAVGKIEVVREQGSLPVVSVFPRPDQEVRAVYQAGIGAGEVLDILSRVQANAVYLLPGDFFLNALLTEEDRRFSDQMIERFPEILEWHQHKFRGGLGSFFRIFYNFVRTWAALETDYDVERLIFVRVENARGELVSTEQIFDIGLRRRPVLLVDLDASSRKLISLAITSGNHKWGILPMPSF